MMGCLRIGLKAAKGLPLLVVVLASACASTASGKVETPEAGTEGRDPRAPGASATGTGAGAARDVTPLPRYFMLDLDGNEARVDGERLLGPALSSRIAAEASDESVDGVVVRLAPSFSGEALGAMVWELSTAGFDHIIVAKASSPLPVVRAEVKDEPPRATSHSVATQSAVEEAPTSNAARDDAAEKAPVPSDVEPDTGLRTVGLHVGGGPNDDTTRAKFIAPIERQFEAMLRCHTLAENRERNASVGVDLLIPTRGGRAELKDLRTALRGDQFDDCIRKAFLAVQFPRIQRPTMISYSMLFEPGR